MALSRTNRMDYLWLAAALAAGLLLTWLDLHTDDTGVIAGLLFAFAGILGLGRPNGAWRWGLAIGLCIPIAEFARYLTLGGSQYLDYALQSFLAVAVALIAVYAGAWLRRASNLRDKSQ